jgi:hypothetical protein
MPTERHEIALIATMFLSGVGAVLLAFAIRLGGVAAVFEAMIAKLLL